MSNKSISLIAALVILLGGFFLINTRDAKGPVVSNLNIPNAGEDIETDVHPISLPALMQKEYKGKDLKLVRVLADNSLYTQHHITYTSGDLTISGIMNIPKGKGPFPVVIMNHGYIDPEIYTNGRGLRREQDYFARRGYVVLHSDYRNHAQSSKDPSADVNIRIGYIEDVINAIYALKGANLEQVNKEKIFMIGHSMGGGIAQAIMVVKPELASAFMLYAPVSSDARDSFHRWTTTRPHIASEIVKQFGSPEVNKEFWDNISPRYFLSNVQAPIMFNHGESDADVPIEWSKTTFNELQKLDKEAILHTYPNEGHEFGPAWPEVMQRTLDFFNRNLE